LWLFLFKHYEGINEEISGTIGNNCTARYLFEISEETALLRIAQAVVMDFLVVVKDWEEFFDPYFLDEVFYMRCRMVEIQSAALRAVQGTQCHQNS